MTTQRRTKTQDLVVSLGRDPVTRTCRLCGQQFQARKRNVENGRGLYCSKSCAAKTNCPGWARATNLYTAEDLETLHRMAPTHTAREISDALRRSIRSIRFKRAELGLPNPSPPIQSWSEDVKQLLRDLAPLLSDAELAELLGKRSPSNIHRHLKRLGVTRPAEFYVTRNQTRQLYSTELRELIVLHKELKRTISDVERNNGRSARDHVRADKTDTGTTRRR